MLNTTSRSASPVQLGLDKLGFSVCLGATVLGKAQLDRPLRYWQNLNEYFGSDYLLSDFLLNTLMTKQLNRIIILQIQTEKKNMSAAFTVSVSETVRIVRIWIFEPITQRIPGIDRG